MHRRVAGELVDHLAHKDPSHQWNADYPKPRCFPAAFWGWYDKETVHRPMMVLAEGYPIGWVIIATQGERDQMALSTNVRSFSGNLIRSPQQRIANHKLREPSAERHATSHRFLVLFIPSASGFRSASPAPSRKRALQAALASLENSGKSRPTKSHSLRILAYTFFKTVDQSGKNPSGGGIGYGRSALQWEVRAVRDHERLPKAIPRRYKKGFSGVLSSFN